MKRYIRTKDGKIFERKSRVDKTFYYENRTYTSYYFTILNDSSLEKFLNQFGGVVKQADTIEKLIKEGDLVKTGQTLLEVVCDVKRYVEDFILTELYTKQCGNYICVACKENGEWRVI